jgi:hypothetical protein
MVVLPGIVALNGETAVQRPSLTEQKYYLLDQPTVLIAGTGAPSARPVAFAKARTGKIDVVSVSGSLDPLAAEREIQPARKRPKRFLRSSATGATQAEALTGLSADEAARRIRDFLSEVGAFGRKG